MSVLDTPQSCCLRNRSHGAKWQKKTGGTSKLQALQKQPKAYELGEGMREPHLGEAGEGERVCRSALSSLWNVLESTSFSSMNMYLAPKPYLNTCREKTEVKENLLPSLLNHC